MGGFRELDSNWLVLCYCAKQVLSISFREVVRNTIVRIAQALLF